MEYIDMVDTHHIYPELCKKPPKSQFIPKALNTVEEPPIAKTRIYHDYTRPFLLAMATDKYCTE